MSTYGTGTYGSAVYTAEGSETRTAIVSWVEFEVPATVNPPRHAVVTWAEVEVPAQTTLKVMFASGSLTGTATSAVSTSAVTKTMSVSGTLTGTASMSRIIGTSETKTINVSGTLTGTADLQRTTPEDVDPEPGFDDTSEQYTLIVPGSYGISAAIGQSETAVAASAAGHGTATQDTGLGGGATVATVIYRATRDNVWTEDISDRVEGGTITIDTKQASHGTFQAATIDTTVLEPYRDWVAPVMTFSYQNNDGTTTRITQQLGLYQMMPPTRTYTAAGGSLAIDGRDALWLLASSVLGAPYSVAAGTNVGDAIRDVILSLSLRHAIQTTGETMPKKRTWKPGTTKLQIANDLARSIGFIPLWVDRIGRIRSQKFKLLGNTTPARSISSAEGHILDSVRLEPDLSRLCNHVVVVGNDPKGTPVVAERLNNDPNSPTSTRRLGTLAEPVIISRFEEDPNIDKQSAADDLADRLMEQGSSVFVRMNVTTLPVLDFETNDVNAVSIETENGEEVASGLWRWERLTMGLGVDPTVQWQMNKLLSWSQVA